MRGSSGYRITTQLAVNYVSFGNPACARLLPRQHQLPPRWLVSGLVRKPQRKAWSCV
jgi:hypothetical protein